MCYDFKKHVIRKKGISKMKNKILTLVLALALMMSMAAPSFAYDPEDKIVSDSDAVTTYFALGDSIGAGCKNITFLMNPVVEPGDTDGEQFVESLKFDTTTGLKNSDVYSVDFSFTSRIANQINADQASSVNGSYVGLRPKDVCHILGKEDGKWIIQPINGYQDIYSTAIDIVTGMKGENFGKLFTGANAELYKEGIKNADVITIELGENNIEVFPINALLKVVDAVKASVTVKFGKNDPAKKALVAQFAADAKTLVQQISAKESQDTVKAQINLVNKDLVKIMLSGVDMQVLESKLKTVIQDSLADDRYYLDQLIKYIKDNNPDAILVVGTMINPFGTFEKSIEALGTDVSKLSGMFKLINMIANPIIESTNKYIKQNATTTSVVNGKLVKTTNYYVADLSKVDVNPGVVNDYAFVLHPDADGQQMIADAFVAQILAADKAKAQNAEQVDAIAAAIKDVLNSKVVQAVAATPAVQAIVQSEPVQKIIQAPQTQAVVKASLSILNRTVVAIDRIIKLTRGNK